MPTPTVLLGNAESVAAWPGPQSPLSWAGVGAAVHSSEAGLGHKGAGEGYLGPEFELGERTPQPNLGTLQSPCVHPTRSAFSAGLPAPVGAPNRPPDQKP